MSANPQNTFKPTTIEDYLRGCVGFEVSDDAIAVILSDREVMPCTDVCDLDKRTKDLCRADLYMWCVTAPSSSGSVEDANGVWKHKEGGVQVSESDKRMLRSRANDIYSMYGEQTVKTGMRMNVFGMRTYKSRHR